MRKQALLDMAARLVRVEEARFDEGNAGHGVPFPGAKGRRAAGRQGRWRRVEIRNPGWRKEWRGPAQASMTALGTGPEEQTARQRCRWQGQSIDFTVKMSGRAIQWQLYGCQKGRKPGRREAL
ncbi:hypothetical protein KNW02_04585 [Paracoccus sp. XHP0099]|uniref:Transposase n=1 Tax=Paracoccus marinaquae TaxID=2841926 RepID=A0ABS6AFL5_9RHOB|nr:hypothetical protein [Paracoccus marinaquae]